MAADVASASSMTSLLRVAFGSVGMATWDAEEERARRDRLLAKRARASDGDSALSWSALVRSMPETTPGYAEHAAHYRRFLGAVADGLGGEATPAQLQEAVAFTFRALGRWAAAEEADEVCAEGALDGDWARTAARGSRRLARAKESLRGAPAAPYGPAGPADTLLRRLLDAHLPLHRWLRRHRRASSSKNSAASMHRTM